MSYNNQTDRIINFQQNLFEPTMAVFPKAITRSKELETIAKSIYFVGCTLNDGQLEITQCRNSEIRQEYPSHRFFDFDVYFENFVAITIRVLVDRVTNEIDQMFIGVDEPDGMYPVHSVNGIISYMVDYIEFAKE